MSTESPRGGVSSSARATARSQHRPSFFFASPPRRASVVFACPMPLLALPGWVLQCLGCVCGEQRVTVKPQLKLQGLFLRRRDVVAKPAPQPHQTRSSPLAGVRGAGRRRQARIRESSARRAVRTTSLPGPRAHSLPASLWAAARLVRESRQEASASLWRPPVLSRAVSTAAFPRAAGAAAPRPGRQYSSLLTEHFFNIGAVTRCQGEPGAARTTHFSLPLRLSATLWLADGSINPGVGTQRHGTHLLRNTQAVRLDTSPHGTQWMSLRHALRTARVGPFGTCRRRRWPPRSGGASSPRRAAGSSAAGAGSGARSPRRATLSTAPAAPRGFGPARPRRPLPLRERVKGTTGAAWARGGTGRSWPWAAGRRSAGAVRINSDRAWTRSPGAARQVAGARGRRLKL